MSLIRPFTECLKRCLTSQGQSREDPPPFGQEMREQEFVIEEGTAILNHGSYGMVPKRLKDAQDRLVLIRSWEVDKFNYALIP